MNRFVIMANRGAIAPRTPRSTRSHGNQDRPVARSTVDSVPQTAALSGRCIRVGLQGTLPLHTRTQPYAARGGTREVRAYYCQYWRSDAVSMLKHISGTNCQVMELVRYSSYGVPFAIPPRRHRRNRPDNSVATIHTLTPSKKRPSAAFSRSF